MHCLNMIYMEVHVHYTVHIITGGVMVGTRVYVGGLSYRVGERDLDRFFRSYGRLRDIVIKNGFGFVVSIRVISYAGTD